MVGCAFPLNITMHFYSSYMQHVVVLDANILFYNLLLLLLLFKHMTYI
jgi:hypothetical protein